MSDCFFFLNCGEFCTTGAAAGHTVCAEAHLVAEGCKRAANTEKLLENSTAKSLLAAHLDPTASASLPTPHVTSSIIQLMLTGWAATQVSMMLLPKLVF